jgi:hypothetical protein
MVWVCMLGSPNTLNATDHVVRVNRYGINDMVLLFADTTPNHAFLLHKRQTQLQGVTLDGEVPSRGRMTAAVFWGNRHCQSRIGPGILARLLEVSP